MAWATALGDDVQAVWERLLARDTGLRPVVHQGRLRNELAAPVAGAMAELPSRERLRQLAVSTIERACCTSGCQPGDPDVQLVLGSSLADYLEEAGSRQRLSGWAKDVANRLGTARPPIVIGTACSSGSDAIAVGAELIRSGAAECCVCGGVDVLTWSKRIAHSTLGTMSPTTLRAFDIRHDGTLLGEGAGFLVLEAQRDGRKPLALLRGAGSGNDACGMTAADTSGQAARFAIDRSLFDAGLKPSDIGLINAHGSGTQ